LHAVLRLSDLSIVSAHAADATIGESFRRFHWQPGQIAIGDRGYCNALGVVWVAQHGADVLVRLNRGAMPLLDQRGATIDVLKWAKTIDEHVAEQDARVRCWIDGHLHTVDGRLIATALPDDKVEEARERVRAEHGSKVNDEMLEMAAYVILFTTLPRGRMSAARCVELYRLRWQVELLFKRWKSLCGFDRLPNERTDTILSWLYAKILLALIMDRMAHAAPTLFPPEQQSRRRRLADADRSVEGDEHSVAGDRQRAHAAVSA
jgi:hypothetical protein